MASRWSRLGNKLGVFSKVATLKNHQESDEDKCLQIIESAVEEGKLKSWAQLLEILRSDTMKMSVLAQRIEAEMSEKYERERQDDGECGSLVVMVLEWLLATSLSSPHAHLFSTHPHTSSLHSHL